MKLRNLFYATFAMTMVACTQENGFLSQDETGVLRTISSGSGKFASRSVVDSKWEQNDAIGVFMLKSPDGTSYGQDNVKFVNNETEANTSVTFTSETGITLVNDKVKFHAYYPWSDTNVSGNTYNVQISDQTKLSAVSNSDLRWAVSDEKDLTSGTLEGGLSLNFAHKLTFLKVKTNVADVKSVSVSGVNTEAQFNIIDGTLSSEAGNTKSIQLCETTIDNQTVYCGIVVPTTDLKNLVIKIVATEDGKDMVYQYVYGDNSTLADGFKGGWQYLFNITLEGSTGDATLDKIEAELGGFEGESSVNGEVSDPQEAVTDITVPAGTDLDGFKTLLNEHSGKISLNFANGEYDFSQTIDIPSAITGLRFIGSDSKNVKLKIKGLRWTQDLEELKFQGVEVESNNGYFIDNVDDEQNTGEERSCRFANGGIVELKDSYFHGINRMFQWRGTENVTIRYQLASLIIDNCRMEGEGNDFLTQYDIASITFKNSTFYNWRTLAYAGHPDNSASEAVLYVENCTIAKIGEQLFEKGTSITFNNNIVVETNTGRSLVYGMDVAEASGNYAQEGTTLGKLSSESITLKSQTELLPNYSGDNLSTMFVPASGIEAGDPRWLNTTEE